MSYPDVTAALEVHLASMTPALETAWENVKTSATTEPFQWVNFLPAEPENPTLGSDFYRERGIMQVTLSYPQLGGAGDVRARAEAIREWFPRGASFASGSVTVHIDRTPSIGTARPVDGRFLLPVSIRYRADIYR